MSPYSIFIVDDEMTVREGLALALKADYHVEGFSTAENAIESIEITPPDLVPVSYTHLTLPTILLV